MYLRFFKRMVESIGIIGDISYPLQAAVVIESGSSYRLNVF